MNVKFKQIVVGTGVIALIFSACVVYAQPFGRAGEETKRHGDEWQRDDLEHREKMMNKLAKELGLTPEQQQQIKKQHNQQKEKGKALRNEIRQKRLALKEELEKQDIDKRKIYLLIAEIEGLMGDQLEQRVEGILAMREILTPEQFKKLENERKEMREKLEKRKERRKREKD